MNKTKLSTLATQVPNSKTHSPRVASPPSKFELNRNSPCYSARDLVLLYTKLKYLETFPQRELTDYANAVATSASVAHIRQEEVRVVRQLTTVGNTTELFSRLATLMHIPCHGDAWNEIVKFAANALPFAEQTESLL
ncbi:Pyridoxal-dependent decarboxylase, partial [Phytophthora palmivora]